MSIFVKIYYRTYNRQQLTKRNSTIADLIQSLRNYYFLSQDLPNSKLIFKNSHRVIVDQDSTVEECLILNKDNHYELTIEDKAESQIQQPANEQIQKKFIQVLDSVVKKLQNNKAEEVMMSRLNKKLRSRPQFAQKISKIGQIVNQYLKKAEFLQSSLREMTNSTSSEQIQMRMDYLYDKYMDFVSSDDIDEVKRHAEILINIKYSLEQKSAEIKHFKNQKNIHQSQMEDLINKLQKEKQSSKDSKTFIASLKEQNSQLQDKINQIMNEINSQNLTINQLQNNLNTQKQKSIQLIQEIENLKELRTALQSKQKSIQRDILSKNIKIDELNQIIQQQQQIIAQKDQQIKKAKQNSLQKKLIESYDQLSNQAPYPDLFKPKPGKLQDILPYQQTIQSITKFIETQTKKQILQINELLSYDRRHHMRYELKQRFQKFIDQKESLLIVGLTEEKGKFFGVFTEEKFNIEPQSYFMPDFYGCSFLFSFIEGEINYFKLKAGENSLAYSSDSLIFGYDDLTFDFEKNVCSSKFVDGKSDAYNINHNGKISTSQFRKFLSDKLVNQKPEQGKSSVNLVHYKIFEIQFS